VLRRVRARARDGFDGASFEREPRFGPLRAAARAFANLHEWPSVEAIDAALSALAGVRFVQAAKRPRRQRGPVDLDDLYDAHIVRGEVPTRAQDWHDLLNALVWATFPRSKAALHARQHRAVQTWARQQATMLDDHTVERLPNARTRELDALALLDEGGVLLVGGESILFGHAHYEGIALGVPAMIGRGVRLEVERDVDASRFTAAVDAAFARRLAEPLAPEDLPQASTAW
jgi:hypothetical protein